MIDDLALLRFDLHMRVKAFEISSDVASELYARTLAAVVRNPSAMEVDDRPYMAVKCRRCDRPTSVARNDDDVSYYACRCSPTIKRHAHLDAVGLDGKYLVDPNSLPVNA